MIRRRHISRSARKRLSRFVKNASAAPARRQFWVERLEERFMLSGTPLEADPLGLGIYACEWPAGSLGASAQPSASNAALSPPVAPYEQSETFFLHSLPGATKVIYMDFTGHQTIGTSWNSPALPNIITPAYDIDGDPTNFDGEWDVIQGAWEHLAELFRPFNVDVTTEDPGIDGLRDTGNGDDTWGIRVAIGGSVFDWYAPNGGGVTTVGVAGSPFHNSADVPCFVFAEQLGGSADGIALVSAHEVGHTLGLGHDGQNRTYWDITDPTPPKFVTDHSDYFAGFPYSDDSNLIPPDPLIPPSDGNIYWSPLTSWGPIMGNGGQSLMQWSRGEYFGADNIQDDLAVISSAQNGFGYRPDDHSNTIVGANPLQADPATVNSDTVTFEGEGIIGEHPAEGVSDSDFFSFTVEGLGEIVDLTINPFVNGRNLDILAKLYTATGTLIATSNPLTELAAGSATFFSTYYSATNLGEPIPDGGWQVQLDATNANPTFTDSITGDVFGAVSLQPTQLGTWTSVSKLILQPGTYYVSIEGTGKQATYYDATDEPWQEALLDPDATRPMPDPSSIHPGPLYRYKKDINGRPVPGYYTGDPEVFVPVPLPDDNSDYGYSNYGSLGYYSITGTQSKGLVVGVDFDDLGGDSPVNWNSYFGGDTQIVLNNLVSEAGQHVPYQLTVSTTGSAFTGVASTDPLDSADLPIHAPALDEVGGYFAAEDETLTFTWSNLAPKTVYQVYVFGHSNDDVKNNVTVIGGEWNGVQQIFNFTQDISAGDLAINGAASANQDLSSFSLIVISNDAGEIVIQVTNEEGFESGIAGIAIAPTKVGTIEGEKWNDVNGNQTKDASEQGLPGWTVYLDLNNDGILNSTSDKSVVVQAADLPQVLPDYATKKSELLFTEVGQIVDIDVSIQLTHTYDADMNVTLISPSGARVILFADIGGSGDHFTGTILDDEATADIGEGSAPFTGTFRPQEFLSAFDGEDAQGIWQLEIEDDAQNDTGVLLFWSISVKLAGVFLEPFAVTDANGNYAFTDLPAGQYFVREHFSQDQIDAGWHQTWAPPPVTVRSGAEIKDVDFGNWIPVSQHGSIHGQKFNDIDSDGQKDAAEPGLSGWIVYLDTNENGVRDVASTPTTVAGPSKPINDFATSSSQAAVTGLGTVFNVEVTVDITHSFMGDLDAFLVSPSGRQVELFTGVGGQYNNFNNLTLSDDATRSIATIGVDDQPYSGAWRPEGLLSDFIGEDAAGIWTLVVRDNAFADLGILNGWTLKISVGELFRVTDGNGDYAIDGLVPGQYIIREEQKSGWVQIPPADTAIPAANWAGSQWTVVVDGVDNPGDPDGADSHRNVKNVSFGNQAQQPLPGDFDRSGYVDGSDYNLWRRNVGASVSPFGGADGDGDGVVDADDYAVWRSNFGRYLDDYGNTAPVASSVASIPGTKSGKIEVAGDVDWFSFNAAAGSTYDIKTSLGTLADSALRLIAPNGVTELALNDNAVGLESLITWAAPADGVYFVEVRGISGAKGTYDFTVALSGADDHGNTAGAATNASVPSSNLGDIEANLDVDWFKFTAVSGTQYHFETTLGTLPDSLLRLIDSNGTTELLDDDDGGAGSASLIDWTAPANGNYYLEVSGYGSDTGTYTLSLTATGPGSGSALPPSAFALASVATVPSPEPSLADLMLDISDFSFELADGGIAVSTSAGTSSTAANQSDSALLAWVNSLASNHTAPAYGEDGSAATGVESSEDLCDAVDSIFDELGAAPLAAGCAV